MLLMVHEMLLEGTDRKFLEEGALGFILCILFFLLKMLGAGGGAPPALLRTKQKVRISV